MRFVSCGASVTGPRHKDQLEPNQDSMSLAGWRGGWIGAVADGLGSRARSDVGSRCACQVVRRVLRDAPRDLDLAGLLPSIHEHWIEAIKPVTPKDAATTLLFARVNNHGEIVAAQLGDGLLLMKCAGKFRQITPERVGYGNQTFALESSHLQERWSIAEGKLGQPGDGVVLLTDGVADDLDPSQLAAFMDALYEDLCVRSRRNGRRWLQSEMHDWATPLHSDDKTIVAIFRTSK